MHSDRLRVLLVDDQVLFVQSLKRVIQGSESDMEVVDVLYNGIDAVEYVRSHPVDTILMDVRMPKMDGVEATRIIHGELPNIQIIMLTTFDDDEYVHSALRYGAVGYLLKDMPPHELIDAVHGIDSGAFLLSPAVAKKLAARSASTRRETQSESEAPDPSLPPWYAELSAREKEILRFIAHGYNNREIAGAMFIAHQTVRNHVSMIYSKLGLHDRIKLMDQARRYFAPKT
jgi:two-component system, NarL family, response regulator DegU